MKQTGIWLDKREATVVVLENGTEQQFSIPSEVDFFNPKGGSRSKTKWGPQDVVQDSKYLETEKHQLKRYFTEIAKAVQETDQLAVFGPAEAPEKFVKELEDNHPQLAAKVRTREKTDRMTHNQFKALVRNFFNKPVGKV